MFSAIGTVAVTADRRAVKPVTARRDAVKPKKPARPPQMKLTHVRFQKRMDGRFAAPKDARPGDYSSVFFSGSVEAMMAKVKDENEVLDADHGGRAVHQPVQEHREVRRGQDVSERVACPAAQAGGYFEEV